MERNSSKRGALKNVSTNTDDPNARFCNRVGCSGRIKYTTQNTKIGIPEKAKFSNTNMNSSARSSPLMTRGSFFDSKRKVSPDLAIISPSESSRDSKSRELISSPSRNFTRQGSKSKTQEVVTNGKNTSFSSLSNIRPRKTFHIKSESSNQSTRSDSKRSGLKTLDIDCSGSSSDSGSGNASSNNRSSSSNYSNSKYGMRKSKYGSISDIVAPSSESISSRKSVTKKKNQEAESSLSRRRPSDMHLCPSDSGFSISDSGRSNSVSGDSKNAGPVRTRRPTNVNNSRTRLSYQQNGRIGSSLREPSLRISQFSDPELRVNVGGTQFSAGGSSSSDDNHRRYNMDGFTEVLLAIERFEQDEELTHEQVLALETNLLETNLFLSGLNLYDQHRDMRLDIDNMSYEELLALEERMGTVSTALSEEAVVKSIEKSIYEVGRSEVRVEGSGDDGDDIKCSICQEEYAVGDETGKLVECEHGYHLTCINQWLRLKNWCPICKAAVASPQQ